MTRDEAIAKGYRYFCLECSTVYKEKPIAPYDDGHVGRMLEMCRCGCDLFDNLSKAEVKNDT